MLNEATPLMLDELDIVPVGQPTYGDEPVLVSEGSDYVVTADHLAASGLRAREL